MSKDWEKISGDLWLCLVNVAKKHGTVTYGEVAKWIDTNAQSVGGCLDYIKNFCERNKLPRLDAVVVRKDSGEPGKGFGSDSLGAGGLKAEYTKIYKYDWEKINYSPTIALDDFIKFSRMSLNGETLKTLKRNEPFHIDVSEECISFTPESTRKPRKVSFDPDINRYLKIYNAGCISQVTEYHGQKPQLVNASYFLAIMAEYTKPQNRILVGTANEEITTQKEALITARNGQGKFRNKLLAYWNSACSATKMGNERLLRASHIKPWCDSDNEERLCKFNGLLLTPNLDALFDKGLITFEDNGKIKISHEVSLADLKKLGVDNSLFLRKNKIQARHKVFLSYHRTNIFRTQSES